MKLLLALLVAGLGACHAAPEQATSPARAPHPAEARLVADTASVAPGQTFTLGLLLKMKPEWHVYWKNPGDSGLPVQVSLTGPEGFRFGEIEWPVPIEFVQPGDIVGYGYTDTVLLPIEVTAPRGLAPGAEVKLAADVSWLVCKDVCIPGKAALDIALPVAETAAPANAELFAEWRGRLPLSEAAARDAATASVTGRLDSKTRRGAYAVDVDWKTAPARVELFPEADPAVEVTDIKVSSTGAHSRIAFDVHVFEGQQPASDRLAALVVFTDASGARRGLPVHIQLH